MNFELLKEACKKAGITEVEVYNVKETGSSVSTFNKAVDANEASITDVSNIRAVYNGKVATVYVENQSDDNIDAVVKELIKNASIIETDEPYFIYAGDKDYPKLPEVKHDYDKFSQDDKIELCKHLEDLIRKDSKYCEMVQVQINVAESETTIQNTSGLNVSRKSVGASVMVEAIAHKDNEYKQAYAILNPDNLADLDEEKIVKDSIKTAESMFGAAPCESKAYPVLLDNKVAGMLLGVFSSSFSADNVLKNMSSLKDKIGTKIFGENITLIDDPLNDKLPRKFTFDDEGVACKKKTVVENGVLKTYFHNLKTAAMMNTKSTANGFKQGVSGNVSVRPSGFYVKPGEKSFDEIVESIKDGLYITSMQGAHAGVNLASGAFNLQSQGYYIKDGKISDPVTLIIVSGNFYDMLNNVSEIGSDLEFSFFGGCGSPSLLIKSLAVSGK